MTLAEMSAEYARSEALLRTRMAQLRAQARAADSPQDREALRRRMAELDPLVREMRILAELTARYYDRSYHRHERYAL